MVPGSVVPNLVAKVVATPVEQDLYTVLPTGSFTIQGVIFTNLSANTSTFRFAIVPNASTPTANQDYLYYDLPLNGNDVLIVNLDCTIKPNRVLRVYSATGNVAVNLFGVVT